MIEEILLTGAENAITGRELCALLNISPRELTKAVERERLEGVPICASCDSSKPGYYLAADRREMDWYCKRLWHRAGSIFRTRRACLNAAQNLPEGETEE